MASAVAFFVILLICFHNLTSGYCSESFGLVLSESPIKIGSPVNDANLKFGLIKKGNVSEEALESRSETGYCSESFGLVLSESPIKIGSPVNDTNLKFELIKKGNVSEEALESRSETVSKPEQSDDMNRYLAPNVSKVLRKDIVKVSRNDGLNNVSQSNSSINPPSGIVDYPYSVILSQINMAICGGSLVTLAHVLTAAHCVSHRLRGSAVRTVHPSMFFVRAGSNYSTFGGFTSGIKSIQLHPEWKNKFFDLAVLTLKKPFVKSKSIGVVRLASDQETHRLEEMVETGAECILAGWGDTEPRRKRELSVAQQNFKNSKELVIIKVTLIPWSSCRKIRYIKEEAELCSQHGNRAGPCQRGSGGPLVCDNIQFGVITRGLGCVRQNEPDIYSRVDTNLAFIQNSINGTLSIPFFRTNETLKGLDSIHHSLATKKISPLAISHWFLYALTIIIIKC